MKKYYEFNSTLPIENHVTQTTEKAICVTVAGGYSTANDYTIWLPKSILEMSEPNEYGNVKVYVPMWFVAKNDLYRSIENVRDMDFTGIVER